MKKPKYYFVYYNCKRYSWSRNAQDQWVSNKCVDKNYQDLIDKHPLQWQLDCNEKYNKEQKDFGIKFREEYMVISWERLTLEEYKEFDGHIG